MEKALHKLQKGRLYTMNRKESYADLEKWRACCNRAKKKNYKKTALYKPSRYTAKECKMILEHSIPDAELSKIIHHSVESIQIKRSRLLKSINQ